MMWTELDLWAFDTETTSLDILGNARIATAALIRLRGDTVLERSWTINPGVAMDPKASAVNGLTDDYLIEHGQDPATAIGELGRAVRWVLDRGLPFVVYNAAFDLTLLEVELRRHHHQPIGHSRMLTVIDPLVLSRKLDRIAKPRVVFGKAPRINDKLATVCKRYRVKFTESHEACADAIGAARLALAMAKKHGTLAGYSQQRLHALQQGAHKQEVEANNWDDTGWPLHSSLTRQAVSA